MDFNVQANFDHNAAHRAVIEGTRHHIQQRIVEVIGDRVCSVHNKAPEAVVIEQEDEETGESQLAFGAKYCCEAFEQEIAALVDWATLLGDE
jgi:hypothetical protein